MCLIIILGVTSSLMFLGRRTESFEFEAEPRSPGAPYVPYHSSVPYFKDNLNVGVNSDSDSQWTAQTH